jgi:hypothetical protein
MRTLNRLFFFYECSYGKVEFRVSITIALACMVFGNAAVFVQKKMIRLFNNLALYFKPRWIFIETPF